MSCLSLFGGGCPLVRAASSPVLALSPPAPVLLPGAVVWVAGGRRFAGAAALAAALGSLPRPGLLLLGGAPGADALALAWARGAGVPVRVVPAAWSLLGRAAGPARNRALASLGPALLVAFPGGAGTRSALACARAAGVPVWFPVPW